MRQTWDTNHEPGSNLSAVGTKRGLVAYKGIQACGGKVHERKSKKLSGTVPMRDKSTVWNSVPEVLDVKEVA
jgi:hypothetical protein